MSEPPMFNCCIFDADGWASTARRCDSPNQEPRPEGMPVTLAVIHSISLPPGVYGTRAIEQLFTNTLNWNDHPYYQQIFGMRVSAHFLIRRDGELVQFVSCNARAWHAGRSCWRGQESCNDFSVGIELEGLEGFSFESLQYAQLICVLQALALRYPLQGVVGHEHIAPGRKFDPGAAFDWPHLIEQLGLPSHYFSASFSPTLGEPLK
jgi:N-acetyl-anhydromuramoyl-L-alanine amidase